jgi:hypothetical protein
LLKIRLFRARQIDQTKVCQINIIPFFPFFPNPQPDSIEKECNRVGGSMED